MPRWVKTSVIVLGILILLLIAVRFIGAGGDDAPGGDLSAGTGITAQRGGA
ncbi:hypothetical protein [Nonomuraea sp. NPDC049695]|uniref:hypothetical protein n=1 Tax=Nonomuraea sp. NPDC049695 TaxID=3154734 RepID=UPI00342FEED3